MKPLEVAATVRELIEPRLLSLGLELFDLEYRREPVGMVLRVYIDRPEGVTLDDCKQASEVLSGILDETDLIKGAFSLEVSSPGVERRLVRPEHFRRYLGRIIAVKTRDAIDGRKKFTGVLKSAGENGFALEFEGRLINFAYENTAKANVVLTDW